MRKKRNLDLEAEMGADIDVTEEEANDANTLIEGPAPAVLVPAPPAPPANLSISIADIQAIVATAITASQSGNQQIADIVTQGIAQARKPIPEGTDQSNPRISAMNPLGERDHPMPKLKCEFFLGTQDPKSKHISRTYPFKQYDLTAHEVIALNTLEAGNFKIKLHDDSDVKVSVIPDLDPATDALMRLVIVVPASVTGKKSPLKNMLPGPCGIVAQITGHDYAKLSNDDLAWFMAEHRAGRFVATRDLVAA